VYAARVFMAALDDAKERGGLAPLLAFNGAQMGMPHASDGYELQGTVCWVG
jgi:hypothetical protein